MHIKYFSPERIRQSFPSQKGKISLNFRIVKANKYTEMYSNLVEV